MVTVPTRSAQVIEPSAPQTRAAPTVFQGVRGATADAFGAAEGRALGQVSQALGAEANRRFKAEANIQSRRAALDRLKREGQLSTDLFDLSTNASQEQDISDPNVLKSAGIAGQDVVNRSVEALRATGASEEEVLLYEATAQDTFNRYRDTLAKKSVAVAKGLTDNAVKTEIKKAAAEAGEAPERVFEIASQGAEKALVKLGALIPEDAEAAFAVEYQAEVFKSSINTLLARGDTASLNEALATLEHPRAKAVLAPEARRKIINRTSNIGSPPTTMSTEDKMDRFNLDRETALLLDVETSKTGTKIVLNRIPDPKLRAQKINDATKSIMDSLGLNEAAAADRATKIIDGIIELTEITATGELVEKDTSTGQVTIRKKANPEAVARADDESRRGLYQEVLDKPTSGLAPAALELFVELVGQIPGIPIPDVAREALQVRQDILSARKTMLQAFALNDRYPVQLVKLIIEDTNLEVSVFKSDKALLIRMVAIAKSLKGTIEREQVIFDNPNQPQKRREAAGIAVADMSNFLKVLNVPEDADPLSPEDPPIQILDDDQFRALEPGTLFIGPDGIQRRKP